MVDRLALVAEAAGAVGHHALALGSADRGTEVGFLAEAAFALAAFRRVERNDVISRLHRDHAGAHLADDAGALMAQDRWKKSFAVQAVERVGIGVADARRLDFDEDLAGFRALEIDLDDFKRLLCLESDSGARLHFFIPLSFVNAVRYVVPVFRAFIFCPCRNFRPGCRLGSCPRDWPGARVPPRRWRGHADRRKGRPCSRPRSDCRRRPASRSPGSY